MRRSIYKKLQFWRNDNKRKPLIINGARQVGKTWIIKEFGKNEYKNMAYINCDRVVEMKSIFYDFDINRLLRAFSSITQELIVPGETLIVLDEIQEVPLGITALKYFCEDAPEYHIIVAGSLLGINLHSGTGFPVGKVNELKMYPMTFGEFIDASEKSQFSDILHAHRWEEITSFAPTFVDLLRQYYYVGGMPEVVQAYFERYDFNEVRNIQNRILDDYAQDFAKHIPPNLLSKVNMVWNSIPSQLAKENKKFIYGALKKGARAKNFEDAIDWLIRAGLIYKVVRVQKIEKPLKFYEDFDGFKLFMNDLGLLGAMSDVTAKEVITGDNYFSEYKGAFTEQYVSQELIALGERVYYYSKENSTLEIDFLIQKDAVHPIEVKAEENVKSKSLRTVYENNPKVIPWRFSMSGYRKQDWMTNIPLYAIADWIICNSQVHQDRT